MLSASNFLFSRANLSFQFDICTWTQNIEERYYSMESWTSNQIVSIAENPINMWSTNPWHFASFLSALFVQGANKISHLFLANWVKLMMSHLAFIFGEFTWPHLAFVVNQLGQGYLFDSLTNIIWPLWTMQSGFLSFDNWVDFIWLLTLVISVDLIQTPELKQLKYTLS